MVDYKILKKAREEFGDVWEYDLGIDIIQRYFDPEVWCYVLTMLLAIWNKGYYRTMGMDIDRMFSNFVDYLLPVLEDIRGDLLIFRISKLDEIKEDVLEGLKPKISYLYEEISNITIKEGDEEKMGKLIGYTGASKVLHMLAPSFFVMWDDKIREHYNVDESAEGYFKFLKMMRNEIIEAVKSYMRDHGLDNYFKARKELEKELGKTILKVLDEYNWLTITKGYKL